MRRVSGKGLSVLCMDRAVRVKKGLKDRTARFEQGSDSRIGPRRVSRIRVKDRARG